MTAVVHIISFLLIAFTAGYLLKVSLSDMLPFVWCVTILVLYVLAYGRFLMFIDILMPAAAMGLLAYIWRRGRQGSDAEADVSLQGLLAYAKENVQSAGFITYAILCIAIPLTQSAKIVTWWDDVNYWASDLKSLYYLGGFASKYANVSPAFGDYPPGVQLAKWYLVHMDRHTFRESLAFTGYYLFNLSFIMPCFKKITGKRVIVSPLLALAAWGFAGIGDIYGYSGFCADLSMAFLFGSVLITATEEKWCQAPDIIRPSVYLAVLVIAKSTGSIWALFGIIIWLTYRILNMTDVTKQKVLRLFFVIIGPLFTGASWMIFCLIRRRVTQTTSTMVTYMTTDKYGLSPYKNEFGAAFVKAFFKEPVHISHTWVDLPPAAMLLLITVLLILLRVFKLLPGRAGTFICVCVPIVGIAYYALIYVAHLTIFATETQYLEAEGMIASIERYGAPFIIGCMLFIAYIWMMKDRTGLNAKVFLLAVLALTNIPEAYKGLYGYRMELKEAKETREDFLTDDTADFLDVLSDNIDITRAKQDGDDSKIYIGGGLRVCRVRDGAYYRVQDTYAAYEASPVSVMSISYDIKDMSAEEFTYAVS
ncbi:MAG: hypothetical protein J5509_03205, partial [Lachnospiraceae bacterium]|nr:hypothetical protein [Lachnospiraceae bacterium]